MSRDEIKAINDEFKNQVEIVDKHDLSVNLMFDLAIELESFTKRCDRLDLLADLFVYGYQNGYKAAKEEIEKVEKC